MPERLKPVLPKKRFWGLVFLVLVFVFYLRIVIDPDLGWHLKVGEYIIETRTIPRRDLFSFSLPDYPYIYHSWLAETLLYLAYRQFGLWGVTFFYCFWATLAVWVIARIISLRTKQTWPYFFLVLMTPLIQTTTYLRIQLFTFLGLCLIYFIFRKFLLDKSRLIWLIPLVFALWANLHGGFFLGLMFFGALLAVESTVFLFREILPFKVYGDIGFKLSFKNFLELFLVFFLSLVSALINPYGFGVYFQALVMGSNRFASRLNLDWTPLVRASDFSWLFALLLFGAIAAILLIKNKVELREKLMILIFFLLALRLNRFVLALMVVLLPALIFFLEELKEKIDRTLAKMRPILALVILPLMLVFFGQAADICLRMKKAYADESVYAQEMIPPYTYPQGAVEYIKKNPVPERLLNDYNWGGYLIWKLPDRKIFIDGRMDNFFVDGESFAEKHWQTTTLKPGWEKLLTDYQIEAILISTDWPLAQGLRLLPAWRLLYEDEGSVLFEKVK